MGKLINIIPCLGLLISSLPGSTSGMHVESLGKPHDLTSVLEASPGKLDINRHSPSILYLPTPCSTMTAVATSIKVIWKKMDPSK